MRIKSSFFLLFPLFCATAQVPTFLPPVDWHAAQPKGLSSVKVGFVGKSATPFRPSISLTSEKIDCGMKEYLKALKDLYVCQPHTSWRDLGPVKMKAGTGRLTEIKTQTSSILQAIYIEKEIAYILTAAVANEDLLSKQKEILASIQSFQLGADVWSLLKEQKMKKQLLSLIEAEDWKSVRQLIEKETSSMGEYWQFLALQEAYGKIFSK